MKDERTKIVVYDLNKTLYLKSSKEEFFKFVCFKKGYKLLNLIQLTGLKILGNLKLIDVTSFKENFFNYLDHLPPETVAHYARQYWQLEFPAQFHKGMLEEVKQLQEEGVKVLIITGGLEIYTKPLLDMLPLDALLGTRTSYENGTYKINGKACKDEEKVRRLEEHLQQKDYRLIKAYSDDEEPILEEAEKAYLVKNGEVETYRRSD